MTKEIRLSPSPCFDYYEVKRDSVRKMWVVVYSVIKHAIVKGTQTRSYERARKLMIDLNRARKPIKSRAAASKPSKARKVH